MIQVAIRTIECAAGCGATAQGRYRITAEVVTTYITAPRTHPLGGAGVEYDTESGPMSLSETEWAYEDQAPSLYSGFPMKVTRPPAIGASACSSPACGTGRSSSN